MPTIAEHKLITLNTRYANKVNGTYNSDLIFNFRGILTDEPDIVSSNICIMNAQIPVSFYTINETNYHFQLEIVSTGIYEDVLIPFGNYNSNTLINAINTSWTATPTGLGNPLTITLNSANGKLTFAYSSPISIICPTYVLGNVLVLNYSYKILGFDVNTVYIGSSITALYPLNLLGVNRLAIRSSKLAISSYNSVNLNLGITLSTIPVDTPAFGLINYTNQTDLNKSLLLVKVINEIDINIVDENNELINFNNIDYTITLVLENIRLIPDKFTNTLKSLTQNIEMVTSENNDLKNEEKKETNKDLAELELLVN